MYRRDIDRHELPAPMDASRFPRYLDALHSGRAIDAHNAQRDPRTSELTRAYLKPLGISALLDASIRLGGEVVAVLCLEHIGPARTWQADEIAFAGGRDVRCADYATYGTEELSRAALAAMEGRTACLLANHGILAVGPSLDLALRVARVVETVAEILWRSLAVGQPVILDDAEMDRVLAKFAGYGKG